MSDVFLSAGVRTPFVKAGGVYARHSALELSIPVVQRMSAQARLGIGEVARRTSLSVHALRFYEREGWVRDRDFYVYEYHLPGKGS